MERGGRRAGSGRRQLPPEERRVTVTLNVKPETKERLQELRKNGKSIGRLIDELVSEME